MFNSYAKLLNNQWADYDEDDNAIVTTNAKGQRVLITLFNDANGKQSKCERVYNVKRVSIRTLRRAKERVQNWKKFGLELLDLNHPDFKKYKTVPVDHDEVISQGVFRGAAKIESADAQQLLVDDVPEVKMNQMNELSRLMQGITSKNPMSPFNAAESNFNLDNYAGAAERLPPKYPDDDKTIKVFDIPDFITEDDLREIFGKVGPLKRVYLVCNKETQVSRGLAFITYADIRYAMQAYKRFNNKGLGGAIVKISLSKKD